MYKFVDHEEYQVEDLNMIGIRSERPPSPKRPPSPRKKRETIHISNLDKPKTIQELEVQKKIKRQRRGSRNYGVK